MNTFLSIVIVIGLSMSPSLVRGAVDWEVVKKWEVLGPPIDIARSGDDKWTFFLTVGGNVLVYSAAGELEGKIAVDPSITDIAVSRKGDLLFLVSEKKNNVVTIKIDFIKEIKTAGSPFMGPARAEVTIIVFSDFQCPGCGKLANLLEQVLEQYPDTVKLVYKNYPLAFHQFAKPAAKAALAAGEQGKFWEYHDMLFQSGISLSSRKFLEIGEQLGLNLKQFFKDMTGSEINDRVEQDLEDGKAAGVSGTPTVFINGRKLKERTLTSFRKVIDAELKKERGH